MNNPSKTYNIFKIAILFGIAIFVSCENDIDEVNTINDDTELPLIEAWDFVREESENGIKMMRLRAEYMESFNDSNVYHFPKGFLLETFKYIDGEEYIESSVTADSARYVKGFRLDAYNNVVVKNRKQDELRTNFLSWDEKKELISTKEPVEIIQNGQKITGIGLVAKQDFSYYQLTETTGIISIDAQ